MSTSLNTAVRAPSEASRFGSHVDVWKAGFIASPAYDLGFFILSPLLALTIILSLDTSKSGWVMRPGSILGHESPLLLLFIGVWTYAHLFAVVFRSHVNQTVFMRFWPRFVFVPIVLFLVFWANPIVRAVGLVLAGFWDVYHTSMQNFGFCRIYDSKLGNPAEKGRLLDVWMNHLVYIGPIFLGMSFQSHFASLNEFSQKIWHYDGVLSTVRSVQASLAITVLVAAAVYIPFYVFRYWQMSREGYRVSPQKIALLLSTAIGSIWAWTFLRPIEAFFVANFFHGLQYFAIVWWTERRSLTTTLRLPDATWSRSVVLASFLLIVTAVGIWYLVMGLGSIAWAVSLALVISLMHFWYDGFIWSVRKHQV
jgi:hypothetical protein